MALLGERANTLVGPVLELLGWEGPSLAQLSHPGQGQRRGLGLNLK